MSAKQRRNLIRVGVRGQTEVIDLTNKFIAVEIADRFVTANTKPIWNNVASKEFTGPVG